MFIYQNVSDLLPHTSRYNANPESKRFIAMCLPDPFTRFHTSLLFRIFMMKTIVFGMI